MRWFSIFPATSRSSLAIQFLPCKGPCAPENNHKRLSTRHKFLSFLVNLETTARCFCCHWYIRVLNSCILFSDSKNFTMIHKLPKRIWLHSGNVTWPYSWTQDYLDPSWSSITKWTTRIEDSPGKAHAIYTLNYPYRQAHISYMVLINPRDICEAQPQIPTRRV